MLGSKNPSTRDLLQNNGPGPSTYNCDKLKIMNSASKAVIGTEPRETSPERTQRSHTPGPCDYNTFNIEPVRRRSPTPKISQQRRFLNTSYGAGGSGGG